MVKSRKPDFKIRRYKNTDKENCRTLWRELVEWHREIYAAPTIGGDHPEDYFDRYLTKFGEDKIWVALKENNVIGFAGLVIEDEEFKIEPIVVARPFRGKGAGKQLVQIVMTEAQRLNAKQLIVEPVMRNTAAIKFYHALGFVNAGQVQLFIDFSGKKWVKSLKMHDLKFDY